MMMKCDQRDMCDYMKRGHFPYTFWRAFFLSSVCLCVCVRVIPSNWISQLPGIPLCTLYHHHHPLCPLCLVLLQFKWYCPLLLYFVSVVVGACWTWSQMVAERERESWWQLTIYWLPSPSLPFSFLPFIFFFLFSSFCLLVPRNIECLPFSLWGTRGYSAVVVRYWCPYWLTDGSVFRAGELLRLPSCACLCLPASLDHILSSCSPDINIDSHWAALNNAWSWWWEGMKGDKWSLRDWHDVGQNEIGNGGKKERRGWWSAMYDSGSSGQSLRCFDGGCCSRSKSVSQWELTLEIHCCLDSCHFSFQWTDSVWLSSVITTTTTTDYYHCLGVLFTAPLSFLRCTN